MLVGVLIKIAEKPLEGGTGTASPRSPDASPSPSSASFTPSAGPPVLIDLVRLEPPGADGDGSWVASDAIHFGDSELAELHALPDRSRKQADWLRAHGAVDAWDVVMKVVVRGNSDSSVAIVGMEAEKSCSAPLRGTAFYDPSAGAPEENVYIGFNLDDPSSRAQEQGEDGYEGDYFSGKTVRLAKGEIITFQIEAFTSKSYCEFSLSMETVSDGKPATQVIDNHGSPFRVSTMRGDGNFSSYQALYLGGVAIPDDVWPKEWTEGNPKIY
ncbi:hypothetical protein [Nonomuraea sp. NPDC050540]|uniref:hypothetical protein n=1 Tax=Nonomuraea sp. NPDC050540 TaxID=3364367 RepID=UPI0037A0FF74